MAVKDKIEDIAKNNPKVDVEQVREAQSLLNKLQKSGLSKRQYEIEPPFGSRPPRSREGEPSEPRRGTR